MKVSLLVKTQAGLFLLAASAALLLSNFIVGNYQSLLTITLVLYAFGNASLMLQSLFKKRVDTRKI